MITPNACPVPELFGNPEPLPKLVGTDVNPLYELPNEPLAPQINVALLIPKPPLPNGPILDDTKVNPLRSTVPDADITTFEPELLIVTTIGADADKVALGVIEGVAVGVTEDVGVGVAVSAILAVGVAEDVGVALGAGASVGVTDGVAVGVAVGVEVGATPLIDVPTENPF
jgi:hypothetical protein